MLLRRSLFLLDIFVLLAVIVLLVFLPAERCVHFRAKETPPDSKCNIHPAHHPNFTFHETLKENSHLTQHKHLVTVCHRLQWSHFAFWENMYLILCPAIMCFILIGATMCEICEFNLFVGRIRSTSLIIFSLFTVLYTIGVIIHERSRIENQWPFLRHVHALGADDSSINVTVPATWQYSIALCILSALFKIGRLLIQHYFGDKKFFIDDDRQNWQKVSSDEDPHSTIPRASGSGILNETRYSKIESD